MSEFGHTAIAGTDAWGWGPFVIEAGGKSYRFEDSDRFGPALIKQNGDPLKNPWPGERCSFWRAHRIWVRQGRRVRQDDRTMCLWNEPKPMVCRRINTRNAMIVEPGEEDGRVVYLAAPPALIASHQDREG